MYPVGKDLLYLVDLPIIDGPATCQPMNSFNPLALKVFIVFHLPITFLKKAFLILFTV